MLCTIILTDSTLCIYLVKRKVGVITMRTLLAIFITLGLMLNSGSGFVAAAFAKATLAAKESAYKPPMVSHAHGIEAGNCHKHTSKSAAHERKCCGQNTKCTHESCACLKCFSVLADVRPINHSGIIIAALHEPEVFDEPPGGVRKPSPPPPQS
jgi:hypothetical protein